MKQHNIQIEPIAYIKTEFTQKFGIPRQSGLVNELTGVIEFEPKYRTPDALREIEGFTHLWLIFGFSEAFSHPWHATVRPPRLGGNRRVGVFASRSPFRPNSLGLSSVRLTEVKRTENKGTVLVVSGVDLLDGTPIYDIKPYIPLSDCHTDASEGYTAQTKLHRLTVQCDDMLWQTVPIEERTALNSVLENDPRPGYSDDAHRVYGFTFHDMEIGFSVDGEILTVQRIDRIG